MAGKCDCKICNLIVADDQQGVCCEICKYWYHIKCVGISSTQYASLVKMKNTLWFCDADKKKVKELIKREATVAAVNDEVKQELSEIRQEIAKIASSACKSYATPSVSYAAAVKSSIGVTPKQRKDESNGVIVVPKSDEECVEVEKAIRNNINLRDIKVGVTRVKHLRNRGVFLGTSSAANSNILEQEISKKLGGNYEISQPKPSMPKLVLSNIDKKYESDEMLDEIRSTNQGFDDNDGIKIVHAKSYSHEKEKKEKWLYILEAKPQTFAKLVNRYIIINFNEHFVKEKFDVTRCFNCQQYGHKGHKCASQPVCSRCAQNHKTSECKKHLSVFSCINCMDSNKAGTKFNTNHPCGGKNCEVDKKKVEIYQSRVNYNCSPQW